MNESTNKLLERDWNFVSARVSRDIHSIHPYPAKFIPQIPRALIELYYPNDGSVLLDPFCGCGTTLVEGVQTGIPSWGIDLNPVACLISRVKTSALPYPLEDSIEHVISSAKSRYYKNSAEIPAIPRLDHWFNSEVQRALAALISEINLEEVLTIREALQVAFSSIIVRVSNQESDTRYASIDKGVTGEEVFDHFKRAAVSVSEKISSQNNHLFRPTGNATVLNSDILSLPNSELPKNVGLVITSPPYPNAYEYWLYHKYRMFWLGMDPISVRTNEIGARPHYFKSNHQDEHDFERQMSSVFKLLSEVMQKRSKACFIVGRSIIHGRTIDNAALLERAAIPHGFVVQEKTERLIPRTRKAFNPANSKIDNEHLLVFSLDNK